MTRHPDPVRDRGGRVGFATRGAFVRAASIAFAAAVVVAVTALVEGRGYGAADLPLFLLVSAAFAVAVGGVAAFVARRRGGSSWWGVALGGLAGAALGIAALMAAAVLLGPNVGASSLPLAAAWIVGGAFGVAFARRRLAAGAPADALLLLLVLLASALVFEPLVLRLAGRQRLEVVWLAWQPGAAGLRLVDGNRGLDGPSEELLAAAGVEGVVTAVGRGVYGAGPAARVYVVLRQPVVEQVELRQPDGGTAVYVQEASGRFRLHPAAVETRDDLIELVPGERPDTFRAWIETNGGRSGRDVVLGPVSADSGGASRLANGESE